MCGCVCVLLFRFGFLASFFFLAFMRFRVSGVRANPGHGKEKKTAGCVLRNRRDSKFLFDFFVLLILGDVFEAYR